MLVIGSRRHRTHRAGSATGWQHDAPRAGVILFAPQLRLAPQVAELSQAIREAAPRPQLVCVDQEGGACSASGRLQRAAAAGSFGKLYARDPRARSTGARNTPG
jgi:beta-N-acetylhexosaminidase